MAIFRGVGDATGNAAISEIETLRSDAQLAASEAADSQAYSEEWANKAEDSLVSTAAGGDGVDDYSALHWSFKAEAAKVVAEAAKVAAQSAQTGAQVAQTAAELAETNAEAAEAGAVAAAATVPAYEALAGNALQYSRLNAVEDTMEYRTALQTTQDLGVEVGVDVQAYSNLLSDAVTENSIGRKNAIINGNFDRWERGILFNTPATNSYTADRFKVVYDGTGTFVVEKSDTISTGGRLRWNQTGAVTGGTFRLLRQPIENVRTHAGATVTVSIRMEAIGSPFTASLALQQFFGSGGTPSASVTKTGAPFTVAVGTNTYTTTIALDSVAGKTLGTDGNDSLIWSLNLPTSGTFDVIIENIQLEKGSVATDFEQRPIGEEEVLCKRYYRVINNNALQFNGESSTTARVAFTLDIPLRATPTVIMLISNPSLRTGGSGFAASGSVFSGSTVAPHVISGNINGFSGLTGGAHYVGNNAANLFGLSAEL